MNILPPILQPEPPKTTLQQAQQAIADFTKPFDDAVGPHLKKVSKIVKFFDIFDGFFFFFSVPSLGFYVLLLLDNRESLRRLRHVHFYRWFHVRKLDDDYRVRADNLAIVH